MKDGNVWSVDRVMGAPDIDKPETHLQRMYQDESGNTWVDTYDGDRVMLQKNTKRQKAGNAFYELR
jgi:hypothetical protein